MKNNFYVDLHVIQTVPPSCVNRDDTGSPKTAVYGGVTRARVSSQSWKRAIRLYFKEHFPEEAIGLRTKKVVSLLAQQIEAIGDDSVRNPESLATKVLEAAGIKVKEKDGKAETGALFFVSVAQIKALAQIAVSHPDGKFDKEDKAECQRALKEYPAMDIALFGRMVADDPSLNFDAAAQVAHSISTHAVHNEYDYFTAVDDCAPEDNAGAGHLGTVEYNSSTLYRYATINVGELNKYLEDETARTVRAFADAFVFSMPTGKINTFANRTRPDAVYVTIRSDQPVNLAGAFENPIKAGTKGFVVKSIEALMDYAEETYSDFTTRPEKVFAVGKKLQDYTDTMPMHEFLEQLEAYIVQKLHEVSNE